MSAMDEVKAAGKFLDTHGPADWRNKVRTDILDMADLYTCILGQVYGDYDTAVTDFAERFDDEWWDVCDAFGDYDDEWKEYLSMPVDKYDGTVWIANVNDNRVLAVSQFKHTSISMVTYFREGEYHTLTESDFTSQFRPAPVYVEGRLYRGCKDGQAVTLVYSSNVAYGNAGFYMLGYHVTYCETDWFEKEYGPITELTAIQAKSGKTMTVTFE